LSQQPPGRNFIELACSQAYNLPLKCRPICYNSRDKSISGFGNWKLVLEMLLFLYENPKFTVEISILTVVVCDIGCQQRAVIDLFISR